MNITKRRDVPVITAIFINGFHYDLVPIKIKDSNGRHIFVKRVVDGKLRMYFYRIIITSYRINNTLQGNTITSTEDIYFRLMLPDGRFINVEKKRNMKNIIQPCIDKCAVFKSE